MNSIKRAVDLFNIGSYNKALSLFKEVISTQPSEEKIALYYICLIYRKLKKWSLAKSSSLIYIKKYGFNWKVAEILGDVFHFEGDYKIAKRWYRSALGGQEMSSSDKRRISEKLEVANLEEKQKKHQLKLSLVVVEGTDNFTDDLVERLSQGNLWVRKFVIPRNKAVMLSRTFKLFSSSSIKKMVYEMVGRLSSLRKALKWGDVIWVEWANYLAVVASHIKPKKKKMFIRLHSYEIFTDYPMDIDWRGIDKLIFVAPHIEEIFFERFPGLKEVIRDTEVVFNGLNLNEIPFDDRKPGYDIAWVAHINYKKAPELSLQVIKKLVEKNAEYKLHIAGDFQDPRYDVYMRHLVRYMDLEKNVLFYGWVDDMEEFWRNKNYLLSTSLHEGHPYNIMEAMARGIKPVIHWFRGADELYSRDWLFATVDDAVKIITSGSYDSRKYRDHVIHRGWTLEDQVRSFKDLIYNLINH